MRTIHIDCNITGGAHINSSPTHTIFEFSPSVDPGFKIDIVPRNLEFVAITPRRYIHNITVQILDQNFEPVNFQGEEITVKLRLERINKHNALDI